MTATILCAPARTRNTHSSIDKVTLPVRVPDAPTKLGVTGAPSCRSTCRLPRRRG